MKTMSKEEKIKILNNAIEELQYYRFYHRSSEENDLENCCLIMDYSTWEREIEEKDLEITCIIIDLEEMRDDLYNE